MRADSTKKLMQSALVAIAFAMIFPALWVALTGDSSRTPVVEKQVMESMAEQERQKWMSENSKPLSFVDHIKSLPHFIAAHSRGYLEASAGVFVVVFILNSAFLLGRRKNEP